MKEKKMTREEVREYVRKIMSWETDELLEAVLDHIIKGEAVMVDALPYMGNGKYDKSRKRYRYKVITPILGNYTFYSTDLFQEADHAMSASYEIYTHTRQLVIKIVGTVGYDPERMGHGYRDGGYGIFKLVI